MELELIVGTCAGILTSISTLPQIIKIFKSKKAEAVAAGMIFVLLGGNALWCWYGFLIDDLPILITNAFSVCCDIVLLILNYRYSSK